LCFRAKDEFEYQMWIATIQKAISSSSSHNSTSNQQQEEGEGDEQIEILFNPTYQQHK